MHLIFVFVTASAPQEEQRPLLGPASATIPSDISLISVAWNIRVELVKNTAPKSAHGKFLTFR